VADPSDDALMLALRDGELAAFDALFRRHYESVRALCSRVTGTPSVGEDLAQETFLRVLRHRSTFRGDARFTTWLYRIAHNLCLEQVSRQARDRRLAERWSVDAETRSGPDRSDRLDQLEAALATLTPEQREIITLCRFQDLPFAEIAAILGCTAGAARVRAHRAILALREAYLSMDRGLRPGA
jgi:RNA polymerase sigma-70 factor (ECF subfamily)